MKTLFIGGTKRGYLTLKALIDAGANIVGIVSLRQDEHEVERYEEPIQYLAEKFNIPHYETKWMKDKNYQEIIAKDIKPDIAIVVGCRILLPKQIYEIPPIGTLAVHDSLLPEYRGFAPLNWSILNGEERTGVTLYCLNELMDGGDIIAQKSVPIQVEDTAPLVYERVCQATVDIILEAYTLLSEGKAPRIPQNYATGSFTCSRAPLDGLIDWGKPTAAIYNQVRALTYPYPGAFTFYEGKRLLIWKAKPVDNPPTYKGRIPGRVINISKSEGYVEVLTNDGILQILEVQIDGEGKTAAANVIKSVRSTLGLQMFDLLERIQTLEQEIVRLKENAK
ncbi:MAG: methionyl-tRNA formyltransferase [Nostoc sp. SerVER01]|nr:methionyl-tRNA formyltransferase [Nostoc sp. SerVER01]